MTIIVPRDGLPPATHLGFLGQVVSALRELCPCNNYVFDFNTGLITRFPIAGRGRRFCRCYCDHLAGCNLVGDLIDSRNTYQIRLTGGGNAYDPTANDVFWNPTSTTGGRNTRGDTRRPPSIGLGHELVHAVHDENGRLGATRQREEDATVRGENQLRDELGEPARTNYGARRVPNRNRPDIDGRPRGCCCNLLCRIVRGIIGFFTDLFRSDQPREEAG